MIILASIAYAVIAVVTAALAATAASPAGVKGWRLAAWVLGLVVFAAHIRPATRSTGARRHMLE